ncbi:MAG: dUTP diphosphatase [Oscillospiraceae bacterium]|nr:dUTP diphosphatase [Oscillospiraceae bacterium]
MELKMKALSPKIGAEIPVPAFATVGSAAMDLRACIDADVTIAAGQRAIVPTGIAIALPGADYVALICARSGLASKFGITMANGVGVIDSDYRGELKVALFNSSDTDYTIHDGDRIAQLMVLPVVQPTLQMVEELDETERGEGGFGSTGR